MREPTLKELVSKLKNARATAQIDLNSVDPRYRIGVEGQIRQASRDISELEQAYRDKVSQNLLVVGLRGPGSKSFAAYAKEAMLCVDGNMVVNMINDGILQRLPNYRGFGGQELNAMLGELNEIRAHYGILSIPPIQNNDIARDVASLSLPAAIDKVLRTNYGLQIHSAVIRRFAANTALEQLYDGAGRLVVGIYNFSGVDPLILPEPHAIVDLNEQVSEETANQTLDKIRQSLAPKGKKTRATANTKEKAHEQQ